SDSARRSARRCLSCCVFYCSRDHRDLHSFPTRRSSDLALARPADVGFRRRLDPSTLLVEHPPAVTRVDADVVAAQPFLEDARQRSEEHTSELQSRRDLVCRLLLEKKKTTNSNTNIDNTT